MTFFLRWPGSSRVWLVLALCAGCGQIPRALAAQEGFREPRIKGNRLDWCLGWGKECGQPAADEFCRQQGYKSALRFEVAKAIGPTQVIGTGETCTVPACDGFLYITCTQAPRPAEKDRGQAAPIVIPLPPEKTWRYDVLARDKIVAANAITSKAGDPLLDVSPIDTAGFRTARLFVQVLPAEGGPDPGKLTKTAKLHVSGFHDAPNGSQEYFAAEVPARGTASLGGWVEIPVLGPVLRIVVSGDSLPKAEMKVNCSLYLLR
jgi:hypothetical protein